MDQFSKTLTVGDEQRLFEFTRMENASGVKFFITSKDSNQKPVACSLRQNKHGLDWKLIPGSLRWFYQVEEDLSDAIMETSVS